MSRKVIDLTGQRFGRLVVIERAGSSNDKKATWRCLCDCGNSWTGIGKELRNGHTQSCGCFRKDVTRTRMTIHGDAKKSGKTDLYCIWKTLFGRCHNPKDKSYFRYGGRGITVCEEWRNYTQFREDMLPQYKKGLSIDRIDNDKGYSKDNCRWATDIEQARNKRNNHRVTLLGQERCIAEWAEMFDIVPSTAYMQINKGIAPEIVFGVVGL